MTHFRTGRQTRNHYATKDSRRDASRQEDSGHKRRRTRGARGGGGSADEAALYCNGLQTADQCHLAH